MTEEQFLKELNKINIFPTEFQLNQLKKYYGLIIEYNEIHNLTRITEVKEVYLKHFYDSITLSIIENLDQEKTLCDIGSGAGFPGIVLKIIFPKLKVTLVDSLGKRIIFLKKVIEELNLKEIAAINERAEDFSKKNIAKFDLVTARAVAATNILLEIGIPMLKVNGHMLLMKSQSENIEESSAAIKELNSAIEKIVDIKLPVTSDKRVLIKVKKLSKTNNKYPRNYSQIKKKPL